MSKNIHQPKTQASTWNLMATFFLWIVKALFGFNICRREMENCYTQKTLNFTLFLNNCQVYKAQEVQEEINNCSFVDLQHSSYSSDIPVGIFYYLFGKLKKYAQVSRFSSNKELKSAISNFFEKLPYRIIREICNC